MQENRESYLKSEWFTAGVRFKSEDPRKPCAERVEVMRLVAHFDSAKDAYDVSVELKEGGEAEYEHLQPHEAVPAEKAITLIERINREVKAGRSPV